MLGHKTFEGKTFEGKTFDVGGGIERAAGA